MFRSFKYWMFAAIVALAGCGDSLSPQEKLNSAVDAAVKGEWSRTSEICSVLLEQQPACVDALTLKAIALAKLNRYPEAVNEIRRALELDPASFPAQYMAGWLAAQEPGREAQAMDRLTVALRLNPTDPNTLMMLAATGAKLNDDITTLYIDMLPPADKNRPELLNLRGVFCAGHNDNEQAAKAFLDAYNAEPGKPEAILNLARFYDYYMGDRNNAIAKYQEFISAAGSSPRYASSKTLAEGRISTLRR